MSSSDAIKYRVRCSCSVRFGCIVVIVVVVAS